MILTKDTAPRRRATAQAVPFHRSPRLSNRQHRSWMLGGFDKPTCLMQTAPRRSSRAALVTLMCLALWGCGEEPSGYFPLESGLVWHYQVSVDSPSVKENRQVSVKNYGKINDDLYLRETSSGNYYYFRKDNESVMRVARRAIIGKALQFDDPERPVIKEPIEVGNQWETIMRPYLLSSETEPHLRDSLRYRANWQIVATDVAVDTPLGEFKHCLHIRGLARVEVPRSFLLHLAPHTMFFEINEWYAPNVGLVKLEYAETTDSKELKGGTINMDLIAFEF